MWGTTGAGVGVPGATESAITHSQNSAVAAAVNAAKQGLLTGTGAGGTIYSIGSQTIVSNTVIGDHNNTDIDAVQNADNSGDVSNHGQYGKNISNN